MATVYSAPKEIPFPEPDYKNYDYRKEQQREDAYVKKLQEWARERSSGALVGEIVRHGVADGYAQYMVISEKPLALIHLALGDAYSAGPVWERGLRITDVRRMVKADKEIKKLFAKKG